MFRRLQLMGLGAAAVALFLSAASMPASAAPPVNAIGSVNVLCTGGAFHVTVQFTHRGPVDVRILEYTSPTATTGVDSADLWFRGSGADTFVGSLVGGTGRYIRVHLVKLDHRAGALVDVVPPVLLGPYSC